MEPHIYIHVELWPVLCMLNRIFMFSHWLMSIQAYRLVYNMTQGFVLHCVVIGSAYKMIWMAKIEKNFYFCIASSSKSFYMHFWSQRNTAQTLCHIINQPYLVLWKMLHNFYRALCHLSARLHNIIWKVCMSG